MSDTRIKTGAEIAAIYNEMYEALEAFKYHARLPANVNRSSRVTVPAHIYHKVCAALAKAQGGASVASS